MTREEATQNLESLINVCLQRGIFQNPNEVSALVESVNTLRSSPQESIVSPHYKSTSTAEIIE